MTRNIVITGGNAGIGRATAEALAARGDRVWIACRNAKRAAAAVEEIRQRHPQAQIDWTPLDLASFAAIDACADRLGSAVDRIDVLINNAGVVPRRQQFTAEGFEMQFGVNHLGHFRLTARLWPLLRAAAPPRVVTVSSTMHRFGRIRPETFRGFERYVFLTAYAQSKLANVLFASELARRHGAEVRSYSLHPGPIRTEIYRDVPQPLRAALVAFLRSPEHGARTSIRLATTDEATLENGGYFANERLARPSHRARDPELAQQLWAVSEELCDLSF